MMTIDVKVGSSVQVGDGPENGVVVKVKAKSGQVARLAFLTSLPIKRIDDGLVPARFIVGLSGDTVLPFERQHAAL